MEQIKGIEILENVSLKNYNTYKIEAKTKYLIKIENIEALEELLKYLKNHKIKYLVLGFSASSNAFSIYSHYIMF